MNDPQNHRNSSMDNCTKKNSFHRSIDWFWNSFSFAGNAAHLHHHSRLSYYPFPHFLRASIIVYSWCMNYLDGSSTDFKSLHANDFWAHRLNSELPLLMPRRDWPSMLTLFFQTLQWAKSNTEQLKWRTWSFELISTMASSKKIFVSHLRPWNWRRVTINSLPLKTQSSTGWANKFCLVSKV